MIDGGIFLDKDPSSGLGSDPAEVLARLERFGVTRALATSFKAIYFDEREGNELTAELCAASDGRLLPTATINMLGYDAGVDRLTQISKGPFLAAALFPTFQNWTWSDYVVEVFAKDCAKLDFPILAGVWNRQDLAAVARHVAPAGGKVLIRWMRGSGYNNIPDIIAVAQDHPNLCFDISTITQSGGIERLVERLGADRLFLASGSPLVAEGASYFMLEGARISHADRQMIQSGTLSKALGLNADPEPAAEMHLWQTYRDVPKIDTHWHTSGWNIIEPRISFEAIAQDFDVFNYQIANSSSIRALNHDIVTGNAETKAFVEAEPRARGLIVVNPLEIETSIGEIEKYRDNPRFVGIKTIQDFYGKDLDDPSYLEIFAHLDNMSGWPIMAHLPGMDRLAQLKPHINFIAAHATWRYWDFADLKNVWFDIATSTADRRDADIKGMLARVGEDRIIFSCDGQLMNPAWTLGKLASADLPETALQKIFQENALDAFPRLRDAEAVSA